MIRHFVISLIMVVFFSVSAVQAADEPASIEDLLNNVGAAQAVITEKTVDIVDETPTAKTKTLDIGKTGFPLPRFVSLKRDKVNVRKGPNESFDIAWTFVRKNLPVEIIAEYDNWRKVRDHFGEEGWIFHSLLSGSRYAILNPWEKQGYFTLHRERNETSKVVAKLEVGILGRIKACDGVWCQMTVKTYQGFVKQEFLWGIYLGDKIE